MTTPSHQELPAVQIKSNFNNQQVNFQFFYWKNKLERQKRKDQPWIRLATVNKISQTTGYNLPNYFEKRTIAELLKQHGEYSYLTGKKLGIYLLITLDLDLEKIDFPKNIIIQLKKNVSCLLDYLSVSHDKTKKGLHIDILSPQLLNNQQIYYQHWGKTWNVGSIQSKGRYVVGEDKDKTFIKNGKWYWKIADSNELESTLNQFFFIFKNQEQNANTKQHITKEKPQKSPLLLTLTNQKFTLKATIVSKQKVLQLADMWKVLYTDQQGKVGYFLLNDYQRKASDLAIGTTKDMLLIRGEKHPFFSRLI